MAKQAAVTIEDIAAQLDRLCPSQVDTRISGNGQQEAGHNAHDNDGVLSIGWYCAGGNCGEPLFEVPAVALELLHATLSAMADGALDNGGLFDIVNSVKRIAANFETIRYSSDASVCMVWAHGEPVRCPSQHDMDTLTVGPDMDDDELAQCDDQ
jgi:hypothetical protein